MLGGPPPAELWAKKLKPWLSEFFRAPLAKNRKMECMQMNLAMKKGLDCGIEGCTPTEARDLRLPPRFLELGHEKPDVAGVVLYEARVSHLAYEFLEEQFKLKGVGRGSIIEHKKQLTTLLDLFDTFGIVSRVLQRAVCYHVQSVREVHKNCDRGSCNCWHAALGFDGEARFRTVTELMMQTFAAVAVPAATTAISSFLRKSLPLLWQNRGHPDELQFLQRIARFVNAVNAHAMLDGVVVETFTVWCASLAQEQPPSQPDFAPVTALRLQDTFRRVGWLPPLTLRQMVSVVSKKLVQPYETELCLFLPEWLLGRKEESLQAVFYLFRQDQSSRGVAGSTWLEVGFKHAIFTELLTALIDAAATKFPTTGEKAQQPGENENNTAAIGDGRNNSNGLPFSRQEESRIDTANKAAAQTDPLAWYRIVTTWRAKYQDIVTSSFESADRMKFALNAASNEVLESACTVLPQVIHVAMSTGKEPIEEVLAFVEWSFPRVKELDVAVNNIASHMESRLLNPGVDLQSERQLVSRLRPLVANNDIRPLLQMLHDAELSADFSKTVQTELTNRIAAGNLTPTTFGMTVITPNSWRFASIKPFTIRLLAPLERVLQLSSQMYSRRYQHRLLQWNHRHGFMTMKMLTTRVPYELVVSVAGAAILLAFDAYGAEELTRDRIIDTVGNPTEVSAAVKAFLAQFVRVGLLEVEGPPTAGDSVYTLKSKFVHRQKTRKVNLLPKITQQQPNITALNDVVMKQRECVLQAAIVRLMKANREMEHQTLYLEVINQVKNRFFPNMPQVKKVIEHLIDAEYIKRKENCQGLYQYLA